MDNGFLLLLFGLWSFGLANEERDNRDYYGPTPTVGRPWPLPQSEVALSGSFLINPTFFTFSSINNDCPILQNAYQRYLLITFPEIISSNDIASVFPSFDKSTLIELRVDVMTPCEDLPYLNMDEQYELKICTEDEPSTATLISQSVWGALRGLETFSQLVLKTEDPNAYVLKCTQIQDYPRFSHRGLMLDSSRHYLPVRVIKDNLDLMAMNKFNVFHWHIVDDQSFPYESAVYPDLSIKGAWSDIHTYTNDEIADIIQYATERGIRVIPEFDTPGHTRSWGEGQPGLLTQCYSNNTPDGTFGPIDPSKEQNYAFIESLFSEVGQRFPEHYLHLGGDEVPFKCWKSNPEIADFMNTLNITGDYKALEEYYITRLIDIVANLPSKNGYMVWQEVFDNGVHINNETVVHVWKNEGNHNLVYEEMNRATAAGYRTLLSSCWYLNYISYGVDWYKYYECDPHGFNGTIEQMNLVIGGEACMWGEYVDETNLIPRTWPRASTVAERLWSPASLTTDATAAKPRLEEHRCRLVRRGYPAEPLWPSYCEGIL